MVCRHDKLEGEEADQLSCLAAKLVDLRMGLRPKSNAKLIAAARTLAARAYELDPSVSLPPGLEAACSTEWALNPVNLSTLQIHPADIRRQLANVQQAAEQLGQANTEGGSASRDGRGSSSTERPGSHAGVDSRHMGDTHQAFDESTAASLRNSHDGDIRGEAGMGLELERGVEMGAGLENVSDEPSLSLTEAQAMLVMAKRAEFMLSAKGVAMVKQKVRCPQYIKCSCRLRKEGSRVVPVLRLGRCLCCSGTPFQLLGIGSGNCIRLAVLHPSASTSGVANIGDGYQAVHCDRACNIRCSGSPMCARAVLDEARADVSTSMR